MRTNELKHLRLRLNQASCDIIKLERLIKDNEETAKDLQFDLDWQNSPNFPSYGKKNPNLLYNIKLAEAKVIVEEDNLRLKTIEKDELKEKVSFAESLLCKAISSLIIKDVLAFSDLPGQMADVVLSKIPTQDLYDMDFVNAQDMHTKTLDYLMVDLRKVLDDELDLS